MAVNGVAAGAADDAGPAGSLLGAPTRAPSSGARLAAIRYALALVALFALALGTRAVGLGGAVTEDEDQWIARSGAFAHGLATRDWRRTYLTGHPGVTVMWLTTVTLGVDRARPFERAIGAPDVTTVPDFLPALDRARVPFVVLQAGLVVAAAALAGRLLGAATGLVAGLLLAAEPFWAGVGPIVGMDGLLTGSLTVSLLALLLACGLGRDPPPGLRRRVGWAVLAGAAFGLAFLSKTTALFLGPVVAALVLLAAWRAGQRRAADTGGTAAGPEAGRLATLDRRRWAVPLALGAGWAVAAGLAVWLLWPAAWASPVGTIVRAVTFSARLGGAPHGPGNFLLGQPIDDPGPLFYPVALLLRVGPGTMVGLLLLLAFGAAAPVRRVVWALLGYAGLFLLLLTLAPKKVDRYLLPILPSLGILAAVGWIEAARRLPTIARRLPSLAPRPIMPTTGPLPSGLPVAPLAPFLVVALLALGLQAWLLVQAGSYPLAAYNPLVGGVRVAERAIPVGWGDGLDLAGQRIRELAGGRTVVTSIWAPLRVSFGAHAPGPVVSDRQIAQADFYVDYVHARQRGLTPRQLAGRRPDAVVTIGGVDYARIYRLR